MGVPCTYKLYNLADIDAWSVTVGLPRRMSQLMKYERYYLGKWMATKRNIPLKNNTLTQESALQSLSSTMASFYRLSKFPVAVLISLLTPSSRNLSAAQATFIPCVSNDRSNCFLVETAGARVPTIFVGTDSASYSDELIACQCHNEDGVGPVSGFVNNGAAVATGSYKGAAGLFLRNGQSTAVSSSTFGGSVEAQLYCDAGDLMVCRAGAIVDVAFRRGIEGDYIATPSLSSGALCLMFDSVLSDGAPTVHGYPLRFVSGQEFAVVTSKKEMGLLKKVPLSIDSMKITDRSFNRDVCLDPLKTVPTPPPSLSPTTATKTTTQPSVSDNDDSPSEDGLLDKLGLGSGAFSQEHMTRLISVMALSVIFY